MEADIEPLGALVLVAKGDLGADSVLSRQSFLKDDLGGFQTDPSIFAFIAQDAEGIEHRLGAAFTGEPEGFVDVARVPGAAAFS